MFIHFTDSEGKSSEDFENWRCVNLNHSYYMKPAKREDNRWAIEIIFDNHTLFIVFEDIDSAKKAWDKFHTPFYDYHANHLAGEDKVHHISFKEKVE